MRSEILRCFVSLRGVKRRSNLFPYRDCHAYYRRLAMTQAELAGSLIYLSTALRCYHSAPRNGLDTSKTRRNEYPDGSLLCVNEQGARSFDDEMRRISALNLSDDIANRSPRRQHRQYQLVLVDAHVDNDGFVRCKRLFKSTLELDLRFR